MDGIDKRCLITPIYVSDSIKMAGLSNCIYRAHSSSKFIMKSLLRFLPVEALGREMQPLFMLRGMFGWVTQPCTNRVSSKFHDVTMLTRELVEKLFTLSIPGRRGPCKFYQIYSLSWPLAFAPKVRQTREACYHGDSQPGHRYYIISQKIITMLFLSAENFRRKFRGRFSPTRDFSLN